MKEKMRIFAKTIKSMKQFLLFFIAICLPVIAHAQEQILQVWKTDGQVISINLNDTPSATYTDGNLVITTVNNSIQIPLEMVRKYTYANTTDGIQSARQQKVEFSADGNGLVISGLDAETTVSIYNVDGKMIRTESSGGRGDMSISVADQPAGVYAVKVNSVTYKLLKR